MSDKTERFVGWCVLELLGHRRLAGYLTEQEIAGASFLRLDVPGPGPCERCTGKGGLQEVDLDYRPTYTEDPCTACGGLGVAIDATQYYSPSAVYCITPTTEDVARRVARGSQPAPVQRWELPAALDDDVEHDDDDYENWPDDDLDDVPGRPVDDVETGGRL